ncbi:MAG: uroporphyrinogen decarboxylase family protein [Armatimonadota bacterium]|nr:uroporphyrinogen decarboxylase family protein [Armatimonadota bacterium]
MTQRERYETALAGKIPDKIPWAVNFDHWYNVNTVKGTMPKKYAGMSNHDISRSLGVAIWARAGTYSIERPNVRVSSTVEGDVETLTYETPGGVLYERYEIAPDFSRARFLVEHMIKGPEDLPAYKSYVEDIVLSFDYTQCERMIEEVGEDGIVLACGPYTPYQEFMIGAAGWVNGIYLLADYPDEVEEILDVLAEKALAAYEGIAQSPAWLCHEGDNMDTMTGPPHYRKYVVPFCRRAAEIHHKYGKLYESHYDGSIGNLLPLIPDTGLDSIEAFTPAPMGDCTIQDVAKHLRGRVVVQGGVPACALCHGFSLDELERLVRDSLEYGKGGGFILGMGDNVPPDADFSRLDFITELVEKYG